MIANPRSWFTMIALSIAVLGVNGCAAEACVEGQSRRCYCDGAATGVEVCDGSGYAACRCPGGTTGDLGPLCTAMLGEVLPAINAELGRRRGTEGAVVPPAIDLSTCPTEIPPFDAFIGRYCDGGSMFTGQLDAQVAAALGACWLQQCGHGAGREEAEAYVADAIANYHALWEDNCGSFSHCLFYGTAPACGTCAESTNCPNVTHDLDLP